MLLRVDSVCAVCCAVGMCGEAGAVQILTGEWSVNTGVTGTEKRLPGGEEELLIMLMTACVPRTGNSSFLLGACAVLSHSVVSNCV